MFQGSIFVPKLLSPQHVEVLPLSVLEHCGTQARPHDKASTSTVPPLVDISLNRALTELAL